MSTLESTTKQETKETSDYQTVVNEVSIVQSSPDFINKHWGTISGLIAESVMLSENREISLRELNNMLTGFMNGHVNLWLGFNKEKITLFLITTYGIGGPIGNTAMYVWYMRGFDKLSDDTWMLLYKKLTTYAKFKGCTMIIAAMQNDKLVEKLTAVGNPRIEKRMLWEVS